MNNAIITGGSDGIGRAIVLELGKSGHNVITIGRSKNKIDSLKKEFEKQGKGKLVAVVGDLIKKQDMDAFLKTISKNFSKIDILINNAGFQKANALLKDADIEAIEEMFKIHTLVPLQLYKAFYPQMKRNNSGTIVNIISAVVKNYLKETYGPYTITKYAQYGLSNMMIKEASKYNIRITNVILGGADTNIRKGARVGYLQPTDIATVVQNIIQGPEEVFVTEIHMHPKVHLS